MPVPLPDELLDLLGRPSPCFIATIMPDGSPQLTQTWVRTDGVHILINTPDHSQKARNVAREPHVAVNVVDPSNFVSTPATRFSASWCGPRREPDCEFMRFLLAFAQPVD